MTDILIADDEAEPRDSVVEMLEDEGYAVRVAKDGGEALALYAAKRPDLLLLDVKMPSVVKAIHELKKLGLALQEPYCPIQLTPKGERLAKHVLSRHTLLRSFLVKLGVSRKIADKDACMMEHILSAETIDKIRAYTERQQK
jgi:CheY-like chemotaxis protein